MIGNIYWWIPDLLMDGRFSHNDKINSTPSVHNFTSRLTRQVIHKLFTFDLGIHPLSLLDLRAGKKGRFLSFWFFLVFSWETNKSVALVFLVDIISLIMNLPKSTDQLDFEICVS